MTLGHNAAKLSSLPPEVLTKLSSPAPLEPEAERDEVKGFAKGIAKAMASGAPDRSLATITRSMRKGKILVDYLRNGRGATAVAPYSTRARPGAAVSMPVDRGELSLAIGLTVLPSTTR